MIVPFLQRRWWLFQNRILLTLAVALILPILLYMGISLVLKNIIVRSVAEIPYQIWVIPGMLFLISMLALMPILYRDFFDLRIHKKTLLPMSLAPLSKPSLVTGILIAALLEALFYTILGLIIMVILSGISMPWYDFLIILVFSLLFNLLVGNLVITLSLLTDRITIYMTILLSLVLLFLFSSGLFVEFEFYPVTLGVILKNIPNSMVLRATRHILFVREFPWVLVIVPIVVGVVWTYLNGIFLRWRLHQ